MQHSRAIKSAKGDEMPEPLKSPTPEETERIYRELITALTKLMQGGVAQLEPKD
jgi:hypothetical protein